MNGALLHFTRGNSYLPKGTWTLNLPSGWTCPGAQDCLAKADEHTGKITNGPHQRFRCYSATTERYPAVRANAWHNFRLLAALESEVEVADLIVRSLPAKVKMVRVHAGGDFFSQAYFDGWMRAATATPFVTYWAFTKSIPFWINHAKLIPPNFSLVASLGGRYDALAKSAQYRTAEVLTSPAAAKARGLEVDTDDRLAMHAGPSFALIDKRAARSIR